MAFKSSGQSLRTSTILASLTAFAPLLLSAAAPAQAEEAAAGSEATLIVTGLRDGYVITDTASAKITAPLRDIPQTINVVGLDVMTDQRALSLQDVMKNIPGVGLSSGDGQRDQVSIRGFTAIADQFVDGLRDDALYYRDLSNIERVEVVKGPASVLYGRGSSGGLINRVTKKPGEDITVLTASYGSWDNLRAEVDFGRMPENQPVAFRITAAAQNSDRNYRDQQFLNRKAVAPSLLVTPGERTTILLQGEYLNDKRVTDFGIPAFHGKPVDVPARTYYGAANARDVDFNESEVYSTTAIITHAFNEALSLRNATRYYDYKLRRYNTLPNGGVNEANHTVNLIRSSIFRDEWGLFNQTELTAEFNTGPVAHQLLTGVEVGRQVKDTLSRSGGTVATVDIFNPVLPTLPLAIGGAPTADNRSRFNILGLYVQDLVTVAEQVKILAGLRFDRFEQKTDDHRPNQRDLARTDENWSPRIGVVWQPDDVQSYYVSWSRSFQPSGEAFALAANNTELEPERTTNLEAGAKFDFLDGKLNATVSIFRLERTNIKTSAPGATRLENVGEQRTKGVEFAGAASLYNGLRAIAGYAYLDTEVTDSLNPAFLGKRATITPVHSANLWVVKDFDDRFGFGAGGNYVGNRKADPANTVTLPDYITIDAMAWVKAGPLHIQLNVYNLFDREYIVSAHGSSPHLNMPGAPRNAMLTLRYAL